MEANKKNLASAILGSHAYGLANKDSDVDIRTVYCTTDKGQIYGLEPREKLSSSENHTDFESWEMVDFFKMLRKGSLTCVELLFSDPDYLKRVDCDFQKLILDERDRFVDTEKILKSLNGLIFREKVRIERGSSNPKSVAQALRIAYCGVWFLEDGIFHVDLRKKSETLRNQLLKIKFEQERIPTKYPIGWLADIDSEFREKQKNRDISLDKSFDIEYCIEVVEEIYRKNI